MQLLNFKIVIVILSIAMFLSISTTTIAKAKHHNEYISILKADCEPPKYKPQKSGDSVSLDCSSYHQTTKYTCGPAAIMNLMRYYKQLKPGDMNQKTELRIALEMGSTESGTTRPQMSSWLRNQGFKVDSGMRVSSEKIINNLKHRVPTLVAVSKHWILAKGYKKGNTPEETTIYFSDSCCHTTIITAARIDSMWLESQSPQNHCPDTGDYIVATP